MVPERTLAIATYYGDRCKDYSSIAELLVSDELLEMKARDPEGRGGSFTDYAGATSVMSENLQRVLERGEATEEDIVATLNASKLDAAVKLVMIRAIEKRRAELEQLPRQPQGGNR